LTEGESQAADRLIEAELARREREAAVYDEHQTWSGWESVVEDAYVSGALELEPGQTAVDVGAGTGRHIPDLLSRGVDVVAIDHSGSSLEVARQRVPQASRGRLRTEIGDARSLPLPDDAADRVICMHVMQHVPSEGYRLQAAREIRRVLKPGGIAVVSAYRWLGHVKRRKEGFWEGDLYRYAFRPREFRALFERAGFEEPRVTGMIVLPGLADRLGGLVDLQQRVTRKPWSRHVAHYLVGRLRG
jgi:SAM-dependent methyltransferase